MFVAIIGCGQRNGGKERHAIGYAHAHSWLAARPDVTLIGVDISPDNLRTFGDTFKLPSNQLFASTAELYAAVTPDYVSICTWPILHSALTIEAAENGVKGIVCEKPIALNAAEIKAMQEACEAHNVKLAIGHQRRHDSLFLTLRQLLQEGAVGEHPVFESRVGDGWDIMSWTVHWFDMANYLFGKLPERIMAGVDFTGATRYRQTVENGSIVFAEYNGTEQAIFITGPDRYHPMVTVRGSRGIMTIEEHLGTIEVINHEGHRTVTPVHDKPESYQALFLELVAAVEQNTPMLCDIKETAHGTLMALAAQEAARTMRAVAYPVDFDYSPLELARQHLPIQPESQV
ncbi:MAG: Gfo/Idh/MocA family oxidoreductase [Chloroflexi bacterium]|nr:Gfo/Idh/MocA family oxidoreductase [Chloroflexota bacterium]OJV89440.1 MAG: hypothetical protein BGO39_36310 [Chloroflexi bacterium 54-19]